MKLLVKNWRAEEAAENTINNKLSVLSVLLDKAIEEGVIQSRPTFTYKRSPDDFRYRVISATEERVLFGSFAEDIDRHFSGFLLDTGARPSEAMNLVRSDGNLGDGTVSFRVTKTGRRGARTIPLTDRAATALRWALDAFPRAGNIWAGLRYSTYYHRFCRARDAAGLGPDVIPYTLRHTCATRLAQGHMSELRIMKWMGHKSLNTTMRYVTLAVQDLGQGADILGKSSGGQGSKSCEQFLPNVPILSGDKNPVRSSPQPLDPVEGSLRWRCGRVAEGGGLLNRYRLLRPIEGSNPSVSATFLFSTRLWPFTFIPFI